MTAHRSGAVDTATNTSGPLTPDRDNSTHAVADGSGRSTTPASTGSAGTVSETDPHTSPARRGTTAVTTRDAVDADLAAAVRRTALMRQTFYILVLLVALVGQVTGSVHTLDIPPLIAIPAVAALELGGVVVMANADVRRRLGERALASRILSAAIATAAVAFNWVAHPDHLVGGFYSAMSALGYLVWLMHAGNQRRDRLRATGDLPPTPPAYEVFGHWIRHPVITARARAIAKADALDLYESLKAARTAIATERRQAAIATVLHRKVRAAVDPTTADIAVRVYDLDEIAARLAATADYHGLTMLLAADLTPERIAAAPRAGRRRRWFRRDGNVDTSRSPEPTPSAGPSPTYSAANVSRDSRPEPEPPRHRRPAARDTERQQPAESPDAGPPRAVASQDTPTTAHPPADREDGDAGTTGGQGAAGSGADDDRDPQMPKTTADAVAYWLRREPNLDPALLAARIGRSLRSVYRYLPPDYPRRPGIARPRTQGQAGPAGHPGRGD